MMLEGSNSSTAISWIREDLDACLESVREHLEHFSDNRDERTSLRAAQDKLEQLNLTFVTMEQRGATMLTDEMIAVGGNMLHKGDINIDESLSALSDAVIVLPSYLDRLQAGHDDLPILLLPTLNELRASYDESLLSEGTLFAPDLEVRIGEIQNEPDEPVTTNDWPAFAKRIRSQFQTALLNWLKEQSNVDQLKPLRQVAETLYQRVRRKSLRRLWWTAAKILDGLQEGAIDNDLPLRRVFARLDLCLKAMARRKIRSPRYPAPCCSMLPRPAPGASRLISCARCSGLKKLSRIGTRCSALAARLPGVTRACSSPSAAPSGRRWLRSRTPLTWSCALVESTRMRAQPSSPH